MPGDESKYVLDLIKDKVVQDTDSTEGTGSWALETAADLHVPHPTITAGHIFRVGSGYSAERHKFHRSFGGTPLAKSSPLAVKDKSAFLETLRLATYAAFLSSYLQGLGIIQAASRKNHWDINMANVIQVWRAGCIIRSSCILNLLAPHFEKGNGATWRALAEVAGEFRMSFAPLKEVALTATRHDHVVPALSATLE